MKVWLGCLACYNDGRLVGDWHEATDAADVTPEDVHGRPTTHDELWCFDVEGFGPFNREMGPVEASAIAAACAASEDAGVPARAALLWAANVGNEPSDLEGAAEDYCGEWESLADYAQELAEDTGAVPDELRWPLYCIDWERAARELSFDGYWIESGYVFSR